MRVNTLNAADFRDKAPCRAAGTLVPRPPGSRRRGRSRCGTLASLGGEDRVWNGRPNSLAEPNRPFGPIHGFPPIDPRFLAKSGREPDSEMPQESYCGSRFEVLLQGFHWLSCKTKWRHENPIAWYAILRQNAERIRSAGFTYVWFPPPCPATRPDGEGYEPTRWHCFDSSYGTESELRAAIDALRGPGRDGPKAMIDVVINHRCGTTRWADFSEPHFAGPGGHSQEEISAANLAAIAAADAWRRTHDPKLTGPSGPSPYEITTAGRHLDHGNAVVRAEITKWLCCFLRESLGFEGFRYDMATGYDAAYVGRYNDEARPSLSVGEVWREDAQELADWVRQTASGIALPARRAIRPAGKSTAFDFALRAKLRESLLHDDFTGLQTPEGGPPGLIGLWPNIAVTFLENHDTEPIRQNGKAFPPIRSSPVTLIYLPTGKANHLLESFL